MKNHTPKHIGEIIDSYLKKRHWVQRMNGYSILQSWVDIIPHPLAVNAKPIKIQNSILFLKVKNHVWANEVKIRKGEIIHLMNLEMDKQLICDVVIKIMPQDFNYTKNT